MRSAIGGCGLPGAEQRSGAERDAQEARERWPERRRWLQSGFGCKGWGDDEESCGLEKFGKFREMETISAGGQTVHCRQCIESIPAFCTWCMHSSRAFKCKEETGLLQSRGRRSSAQSSRYRGPPPHNVQSRLVRANQPPQLGTGAGKDDRDKSSEAYGSVSPVCHQRCLKPASG